MSDVASVHVSKMSDVARAQLTFQMLTLYIYIYTIYIYKYIIDITRNVDE